MILVPAIDLIGGRCVRLAQGDFARETRYSEDPAAALAAFAESGASEAHLVDLDGARARAEAGELVGEHIAVGVVDDEQLPLLGGAGAVAQTDVGVAAGHRVHAHGGAAPRRDVYITVVDYEGQPEVRFVLAGAWPRRLEYDNFRADATESPVERLVLVHEGLERA